MTGTASEWVDVIVGQDDPASAWMQIFNSLRETCAGIDEVGFFGYPNKNSRAQRYQRCYAGDLAHKGLLSDFCDLVVAPVGLD